LERKINVANEVVPNVTIYFLLSKRIDLLDKGRLLNETFDSKNVLNDLVDDAQPRVPFLQDKQPRMS